MRSVNDRYLKPGQGVTSLSTILLDSNMTFIETVPWERAVTMIHKGSVNVLGNYTEEIEDGTYREVRIKSPSMSLALPFMVSLVQFVYDPYAAYLKSNSDIATKRAILTRDGYVCAYQYRLGKTDKHGNIDGCTYKADTVDHITPQSKGGPNTWTNLIAACKWCNNRKADRTPEEAGMTLLWTPTKYDGGGQELQQEIWDFLMSEAGAV